MPSSVASAVPGELRPASQSASAAAAISARMDRLPATRYVWTLVALLSLGGFFEIYDLIFTGYIAPGLARSGLLSTTTETFFGFKGIAGFIAATFAGLFVGTFFLGFLPDRYGRRLVFTFALLWYSVGSAVMAFQQSAEMIILWRFITGIGVGVEIVTIDVYIMELVPQHMRGRAIAFNQAVMFTAAPVAALVSYFLVPIAPFGFDGWRWVVLIGSAGALFAWFIRLRVPESPRWLAQRGRIEAADKIVSSIESRIQHEYGQPLPPPPPPIPVPVSSMASFGELFKQPYLARLVMLLAFNFFQAIGYYGFNNWVPTLLIEKGITVTKSLWYAFVIAIASPLAPLLVMSIADKFERKWLIVAASVAIALCGMIFSVLALPAAIVLFGILITVFNQLMSVSYHAYQTEVFPTRVRSRAAGLVYSFSRIGAALSGFLIAFLLRDFGVVGVFAGMTVCYLVVIVVIALFGPRTTGRRLEEIAH